MCLLRAMRDIVATEESQHGQVPGGHGLARSGPLVTPVMGQTPSSFGSEVYSTHPPINLHPPAFLTNHTENTDLPRSRLHPARMSIQVYVGHTGQRLSLDPSVTSTVEALRAWLAQQAAIQPRNQILLTAQGKQVRTQTLLTENELFVFDSARLTAPNATSPSSSGLTSSASSDFKPGTIPDAVANQNDLQSWQSLFRVRKGWASALLHGCGTRSKQAERYMDEKAVIERSLGIAVTSLQAHIKSAEQKYAAAETWAEELLREQHAHLENWEQNLGCLRSLPARSEFAHFLQYMSPATRRMSQQSNAATLQMFVDVAATKKAAVSAQSLMSTFAQQVNKVKDDLETAAANSEELLRAVDQLCQQSTTLSTSEPAQLLEEIRIVVKKMASDLEHVQALPHSAQSISQASKMAQLHTRNYLPSLNDFCGEMNELVQRTRQKRDSAAELAMEHMRTLSRVESQLAEVYADVKSLEMPHDDQDAFVSLSIVARLPSVYGQLLVESVRRREWVAKMKRDSSTLQEEVATYQEEEDKRRKKWVRSVEDVVKPEALQNSVLGIELSLQNEGGSWPMVTREELQTYLGLLLDVFGRGPVADEMDQIVKDLDKPTRKQIKHAKAFKNGSMHEAAFGDTSLLLRGDEQHKVLKEQNVRLEEELRGQKSRVRKLEDLLHRQSQMSRASAGDMFTPQSGGLFDRATPPSSTPQHSEEMSRNLSMKHRRLSSNQAVEEKKLARRIVDLEAELKTAQEEATTRKNSDVETQKQVEEAMSTKKDLMENMEAQQREFASERRALENELAEAKERIEEVENENERLIGSRDDERTGIDARVAAFEEEVVRLKDDAHGHAARAATEHDARAALEGRLELAETARGNVEAEIRQMQEEREQRQEADAEQTQSLATACSHLSTDAEVPSGLAALSVTLEELARRSATQVKDLADAVAFAKSENGSLWTSNERQKSELSNAAKQQSETEDQIRRVEDKLSAEQAKVVSMEQQLVEEREQLRILRTNFAEGETGSEVLRQRISEEEKRNGKLSSDLAEAKSHINSLDVELMRLQRKHQSYLAGAEAASKRLEQRAERAKDVSQRFFSQIARLSRLLERLGLVVSYQDDVMVIERASKMGASTSIMNPRDEMSRTTSLTSPPPTRKSSTADHESLDLAVVRWPDAQTPEEENAQFEAFLQHISRFDFDSFTEAVVKRLKDYEYTAKKYIREARELNKRADAYKERSTKLKNEAYAKIAVKDFKEGDLALFLPTRGQAKGAWAAFNIGCPHYFLAEKEGMRLGTRDFIVARIAKVEHKVVNLSKTMPQFEDGRSLDERSETTSFEDDNPFELSDGLTWWMVHATEERGASGAPTTPGLGKSTVASANVDAKGSIRIKRNSKSDDASKHLNKSLDSRRSSSTSKRSVAGATVPTIANANGSPTIGTFAESVGGRQRSESQTSLRPPPAPAANSGLGIINDADAQPQHEQVRQDLLWGP